MQTTTSTGWMWAFLTYVAPVLAVEVRKYFTKNRSLIARIEQLEGTLGETQDRLIKAEKRIRRLSRSKRKGAGVK